MPVAIKKIINILIVYRSFIFISPILINACASGKKSDIKEETEVRKDEIIEFIRAIIFFIIGLCWMWLENLAGLIIAVIVTISSPLSQIIVSNIITPE
jgi:hypothetical protein